MLFDFRTPNAPVLVQNFILYHSAEGILLFPFCSWYCSKGEDKVQFLDKHTPTRTHCEALIKQALLRRRLFPCAVMSFSVWFKC